MNNKLLELSMNNFAAEDGRYCTYPAWGYARR